MAWRVGYFTNAHIRFVQIVRDSNMRQQLNFYFHLF